MTEMAIKRSKGWTLLELLAALALLALLAIAILAAWNARSPSAPAPAASLPLIPYPPPPTAGTSGAVAAAGVAQGEFIDGLTAHRRLTSQTYTFFRYDHFYQLVPSNRPKRDVIFQVNVSAVNAGDSPEITRVSSTTGSRIVTRSDALIVTNSDGEIEIEIYIPVPEFSGNNTLRITVEEVNDTGAVIRRVRREDVTIVPP